jgi:hypothetical protein
MGYGNNFKMEKAVTDFPEPLSPTNANVSLGFMVKLTPCTASTTGRPGGANRTERFFTLSNDMNELCHKS